MANLVTVVVCTYNRAASLRSALKSLVDLTTDGTFEYEIVVVDDGSTDSTRESVRSIADETCIDVRYARGDHSGVAAARNFGIINARGDWVAFFDDDQLATPEWLLSLMRVAKATNAECVGGPYLLILPPENELVLTSWLRSLLGQNPLMLEAQPQHRARLDPRRGAIPGTGNALVRKALFGRIGMFSQALHAGEDLEFFSRAQRSGAKLSVTADAIVYHVIPPERLAPIYLLTLAAQNGRSAGEIDARVAGVGRALWIAALRLLHLSLWILPRMLFHLVMRNQGQLLSVRCAGRYTVQYITAVRDATSQQLLRPASNAKEADV